jgi:hypothetical protein
MLCHFEAEGERDTYIVLLRNIAFLGDASKSIAKQLKSAGLSELARIGQARSTDKKSLFVPAQQLVSSIARAWQRKTQSWDDPVMVFARPEGGLRPNFCIFNEDGEALASGTQQENGTYMFEIASSIKLHGTAVSGSEALANWRGGGWVTLFPFVPDLVLVDAGAVRDNGGILAKRHSWMRDDG